jgi:branched-subunit amino acid ABC-type transport system permease component
MDEKMAKSTWLRIAAAVLLGGVIGGILFLIAALIIGAINDLMGMTIPINLRIAENVWSLGLLIIFIGFSIAGLWWKVETTPPSEPENPENLETPASGIPDD